jgi:SSS family solute:Na+ symporter
MLGLFWRRATNKAAIWGAVLSIPVAMFLKAGSKGWFDGTALETLFPVMPFMNQMGVTAVITVLIVMIISYIQNKGAVDHKALPVNREMFKTGRGFNISALVIIVILVVLYTVFW